MPPCAIFEKRNVPVSSWTKPRRSRSMLTFSRNRLLQMSMETLEIAQHGSFTNRRGRRILVRDALEKAMMGSVHYHHSHHFPSSHTNKNAGHRYVDTEFHVEYCASLEAVSLLKGSKHIGVLNSANSKKPGGNFCNGTVSQEDCLCRASLLYPCIAQFRLAEDHFYQINNSDKYSSGGASSCAIFSPRVPVVREDNVQGNLLDDYYECSFVSIPSTDAFSALNVERTSSPETEPQKNSSDLKVQWRMLHRDMSDRIFRALSIFAEQGCTDIILPAFGCGANGNDPMMVACLFQRIITQDFEGCFRTVVFSIQRSRIDNYEAFSSVFQPDYYQLNQTF